MPKLLGAKVMSIHKSERYMRWCLARAGVSLCVEALKCMDLSEGNSVFFLSLLLAKERIRQTRPLILLENGFTSTIQYFKVGLDWVA